MNEEINECSRCGRKWKRGESGEHQCAEWLQKKIERLEGENLKQHRVMQLLIVGGFLTEEKVQQAGDLIT